MTDQPISEHEDTYGPGPLPPHPEDVAAHEARFPMWGPPHHDTAPEVEAPAFGDPEPGDDGAMTGAEFRAARESLGMNLADFAAWLNVNTRTIQRWEAAAPAGWGAYAISLLCEETDRWVDILARHRAEAMIYRSGWRLHDGQWALPESWWRAVVGRARRLNPTLAVSWDGR